MNKSAKTSGDGSRGPMRVLLTGAAGFVSGHLIKELQSAGHSVFTTDAVPASGLPEFRQANLCDAAEMRKLVEDVRPDACIHLGAISSVPEGEADPGKMFSVNIGGTVNLLRALSSSAPNARFLFISTAQVYGGPSSIESGLVDEDAPALPMTFYSISKEAAERAVMAYSSIYGLDAFIARPANHTGPGQSTRFVAASFAEQAKKILRGEASSYVTGNLKSVRDFTDVRDVVRAYRLLIERGRRGEIYNISSGTLVSIGELLECIKKISGAGAPSSEDPSLIRPTDSSRRLNTAKLRETTGWEPSLSLSDTLRDMLV